MFELMNWTWPSQNEKFTPPWCMLLTDPRASCGSLVELPVQHWPLFGSMILFGWPFWSGNPVFIGIAGLNPHELFVPMPTAQTAPSCRNGLLPAGFTRSPLRNVLLSPSETVAQVGFTPGVKNTSGGSPLLIG